MMIGSLPFSLSITLQLFLSLIVLDRFALCPFPSSFVTIVREDIRSIAHCNDDYPSQINSA